jgi:hypothetical protein
MSSEDRNVTPILQFTARGPFRFRQHNSGGPEQVARAGGVYFTTSEQFANNVLVRHPEQFGQLRQDARIKVLPRARWSGADLQGKRVLVLLPSQALGSNVATFLFLQALKDHRRPRALGVFCARSAGDIYRLDAGIETYELWIARKEFERWDVVIDLGQLEARRDVEIWPVDMEGELLEAFDLRPSPRYAGHARPLPGSGPLSIGVLPLASSPLRTLPPAATLAVVDALAVALGERGHVTLCLNKDQHQGRLYQEAVAGRLPEGVRVVDGFPSIGRLLAAIDGFDYVVLADSGPAHMAKLFRVPGVAVYTSAPGEVLQGRFTHLARWTVPFEGPHCRAPCGLAKLRATAGGRMGCMGSLGTTLDALPSVARGADPKVVEQLMLERPVPCVAHLRDHPEDLADFVVLDFTARRKAAGR